MRRKLPALFGALVFAASATAAIAAPVETSPPSPPSPPLPPDPVVLVTLDGVRWQEIFEGTEPSRSHEPRVAARDLLPHLYKLGTERGAFVGAPGYGRVEASGPFHVSLPGYTEIFGGRAHHACADNECARTEVPTLLDEASAHGKVAAFAAWTKIDRAVTADPGAFLVSCGPSSRRARQLDPDALRSDGDTANAALALPPGRAPRRPLPRPRRHRRAGARR